MNIFYKEKLPILFYNQLIPNSIVLILAIYLTMNKYSPLHAALSIGILFFYSYFIHMLFHLLPSVINVHMIFHHIKTDNVVKKYINLFIETFVNIGFFIIFYLLQKLLHFEYVPTILILFYGLLYTSVHIINYSIFHTSEKHVTHHITSDKPSSAKNYGPDFIDHVFGTNSDEEFKNYNHILPNILISFIITYHIYEYSNKL
jgi:hypothetical protein